MIEMLMPNVRIDGSSCIHGKKIMATRNGWSGRAYHELHSFQSVSSMMGLEKPKRKGKNSSTIKILN